MLTDGNKYKTDAYQKITAKKFIVLTQLVLIY